MGENMKTEAEFQEKLKKHMRRARKAERHMMVAKKLHISPGVYFAYERGALQLSVYQLYVFMHATGQDAEYIRQLFDDDWQIPPKYIKAEKE